MIFPIPAAAAGAGEQCVPEILVDPCMDYSTARGPGFDVPGEQPGLVSWRFNGVENGSVQLGSSQVDQEDSPGVPSALRWRLPEASDVLPMTKCRVCGFGQVGDDQESVNVKGCNPRSVVDLKTVNFPYFMADPRRGYYESDIYFGQNSIESVISEENEGHPQHQVYLVDAVKRRLTPALAVLPKNDENDEICCRVASGIHWAPTGQTGDSYRAHIFTVLPTGYQRFMVVPVSNLGNEMPAGTLSDNVVDNEGGELYHLGIFPPGNFSFLVAVAAVDDMKAGNGSLMLRSPRHEVQLPCSQLRLLEHAVVVPVLDRSQDRTFSAHPQLGSHRRPSLCAASTQSAMGLLRSAARIANVGLRPMSKVPTVLPVRQFASRSMPRLGHNLEDHFDFAEFTCKMHSPIAEYMFWGIILSTFITSFGPLLHSNYYFTGRFLPKDQGNTQLCDDSW
ncbi:unnamed protein product [Cladocopium goreaui]|uniref:Uncharacterized protein n=1 Tax=Cladocopium goreaui TaxID=2562237 RepID=A0A9P1D940_9DINO|nr:unnamed protein product [Cladocopium goreaui]